MAGLSIGFVAQLSSQVIQIEGIQQHVDGFRSHLSDKLVGVRIVQHLVILGQAFQDLDRGESDDVIDTNVIGLIRMTSHIVPGMIARNRGHIVNIGSISSFTPYPKSAVYCASKFAVDGFTQSLRMDMADTAIRITQIDPGVVLTGFQLSRYKADKAAADAFVDSYPVGLTPDDVARSICFALEQPAGVMIDRIVLEPMVAEESVSDY